MRVALLLLAACGSTTTSSSVDGGPEPSLPDAYTIIVEPPRTEADPIPPAPAAEPRAPVLESWPDRSTCPPGQAHFIGDPSCSDVGAPCTGEWPASLPADRPVVFVQAGAPSGGDGTIGAPYVSIRAAIARAPAGAAIAIARGTYDELIALPEGTLLLGACAAETRIAPSDAVSAGLHGAVHIAGANTELADLAIAGNRRGLTVLSATASVHLHGVIVDSTRRTALAVRDGSLTADTILVRDTRPDTNRAGGRALAVDRARATIDRAVFLDNASAGITAQGEGAELEVRRLAIAGVEHDPSTNSDGHGIELLDGVSASIADTSIEDATTTGIYVEGANTRLVLSNALVRRTRPEPSGDRGGGMIVGFGATAAIERLELGDNHFVGLLVTETASVTASDVSIERTTRTSTSFEAIGAAIARGAKFRGRRLHIAHSEHAGIVVDGAEAVLEDVELANGPGIAVSESGLLVAAHLAVRDATTFGVLVRRSTATLSDVIVERTRLASDTSTDCAAIELSAGARVMIERARLADNTLIGVAASGDGSVLEASDLQISDTAAVSATLHYGGIAALAGARVHAQRVLLERSSTNGAFASGPGAILELEDARVIGAPLFPDRLSPALSAVDHAMLVATNVAVEDNADVGFIAAYDGSARITTARFARSGLVELVVAGAGTATITDVRLDGGGVSRGVELSTGGHLALERAALADHRGAGIVAAGRSVRLTDVSVEDTRSLADSGEFGYGVSLQDGVRATLERVHLARNRSSSFFAGGRGTIVDATALEIFDTARPACAATRCPEDKDAASALTTYSGSSVRVRDFELRGSELIGVYVTPFGGDLELADGVIASNPIGINVADPGFDYDRIRRVRFLDNEVNLDSLELPIAGAPDATPILP